MEVEVEVRGLYAQAASIVRWAGFILDIHQAIAGLLHQLCFLKKIVDIQFIKYNHIFEDGNPCLDFNEVFVELFKLSPLKDEQFAGVILL